VSKASFGGYLKELRIKQRLSLRDVCSATGYDPSNWSKIERGLLAPPSDDGVLQVWAKVLKLKKGTAEYTTFLDKAALAKGQLPKDILENETILSHMPAFFRTVRGEKPSKEDLDQIIDILKRS
jgi:transcriptional regulator with XRE-family HTH domain